MRSGSATHYQSPNCSETTSGTQYNSATSLVIVRLRYPIDVKAELLGTGQLNTPIGYANLSSMGFGNRSIGPETVLKRPILYWLQNPVETAPELL